MFLFIMLLAASGASGIEPGPLVTATKGQVWPKPQNQETSTDFLIIRPNFFTFKTNKTLGCPNFINDAFTRYWKILADLEVETLKNYPRNNNYFDSLTINLNEECSDDVLPSLGDVENYTLIIDSNGGTLDADTIWGVLRGLETFSQLIYLEEDMLIINVTKIVDYPRFPHRGFLLDTSRHFMPVPIIFKMLDALAFNKFNVFHWHITDDHSFPYKSRIYPELSDKGAYHPVSKVYQQSDIKNVIEYARLRGIRVIPEIDTPGHTRSWGSSHLELLSNCYDAKGPTNEFGPLDPTKNTTYEFITNLFTEIVEVFPESYFHIGGDEVDFKCWKSNPAINSFMSTFNISSYEKLESFYIQKVVDLLNSLQSKYLVWEEVFVNGVELPNSTVVHVWRNFGMNTLNQVTKAGKYGLFSSCWYLSDLQSGGDWQKFYKCDPHNFSGSEEQKRLVLGGEACMWGEYVNQYSVLQRVWPRASAIGERLWSSQDVVDVNDAQRRLEEHSCRMNVRDIPAQPPNGPGVCL